MPIDDMTTKTDTELATIQARHHHQEEPYILAEKEWQRRLMKEQHELNKESVRLASTYAGKWAIIGAIVGALLTTILGVLVSIYLSKAPQLQQQVKDAKQVSVTSKAPIKRK